MSLAELKGTPKGASLGIKTTPIKTVVPIKTLVPLKTIVPVKTVVTQKPVAIKGCNNGVCDNSVSAGSLIPGYNIVKTVQNIIAPDSNKETSKTLVKAQVFTGANKEALMGAVNLKQSVGLFSIKRVQQIASNLNALTTAVRIKNQTGIDITKTVYQPIAPGVDLVSDSVYNALYNSEAKRSKAITESRTRLSQNVVDPLAKGTVKYERSVTQAEGDVKAFNTLEDWYQQVQEQGTPGTDDPFAGLFDSLKWLLIGGAVLVGIYFVSKMVGDRR